MISESNVELEKSYQKKHKKVDNEVDSHINGLSKNNKDAVKNLILSKDVNSVKNNERTEKEPSGQKRVFILGDSIINHLNGYEILGKLENCKVFVRLCHGATIKCLEDHLKPVLRENPDEIIFLIETNDLLSGKGNKDIKEAIFNLAMSVKTQTRGVLVSGITVRKK